MAPTRSRTRALPAPVLDTGTTELTMDQRQPGLAAIMAQVTSRMGANVMRRATAVPGFNQIETGIFTLDMALLGGIPEGLTTMIFGWESSGKTTLAKRVAGRMQKKYPNKAVIFVDLEQTYDRQWGAKHGIDNERLIIVSPESGEQAVDVVDACLRAPETALIIIDSLPTLVPMAEANSSAEDTLVAARSRLIGRLCSKILQATITARNHGNAPTVILINQWRLKIGVSKGDPRTLPGGQQPKFLCTTMIEMKNKEIAGRNSRDIEIVSHNEHAFVIKKSRVGNSSRTGEFVMIRDPEHALGEGAIDDAHVVVSYAKKFGLLTGGGASWRIDGLDRKFGKMAEVADFLEAHEEELLDLKRRLVIIQRTDMGLLPLPRDNYLLGFCETISA